MSTTLAALAFASMMSSTPATVSAMSAGFVADMTEKAPYDWNAISHHMRAAVDVLAERTQAEPPWVRLWRGHETVVLSEPEWIEHTVTPGERLTQIAVRYGVDFSDLREWNRIRSRRGKVNEGRVLKVHARRLPVARQSLVHQVHAGEDWSDIAAAYRVEEKVLRQTNPDVRTLRPGEKLTVWYDPSLPWTVGRQMGAVDQLAFDAPVGAESYGRPEYGRLLNAVQVPESQLYARRSPNQLWGSSHAIEVLMGAIAQFRYETGHRGLIQLNSMSLRSGRRFFPHKSHQSGRDIDIHLPLLPGVEFTNSPNADEVDWWATWSLVRSFLETDQVVYIFLNRELQRRLYEAARSMGESHESLAEVIEWAHGKRHKTIIRHSRGHDDHIHVRFACGPDESRCSGGGDSDLRPTRLSMRRRVVASRAMAG